jgi:hypothetical protein
MGTLRTKSAEYGAETGAFGAIQRALDLTIKYGYDDRHV